MKNFLIGAAIASFAWGSALGYIESRHVKERADWECAREQLVEQVGFSYDLLTTIFGESFDPSLLQMDEVGVAAYSPSFDETDSNPWETSSGEHVTPGGAAFTDDLGIPDGKRVFVVDGPMLTKNDRKPGKKGVDIWCPDKKTAMHIGYTKKTILWMEDAHGEGGRLPTMRVVPRRPLP